MSQKKVIIDCDPGYDDAIPETARIVFESGFPIVMVGLDVMRKVVATPQLIAAIEAHNTPFSAYFQMLRERLH